MEVVKTVFFLNLTFGSSRIRRVGPEIFAFDRRVGQGQVELHRHLGVSTKLNNVWPWLISPKVQSSLSLALKAKNGHNAKSVDGIGSHTGVWVVIWGIIPFPCGRIWREHHKLTEFLFRNYTTLFWCILVYTLLIACSLQKNYDCWTANNLSPTWPCRPTQIIIIIVIIIIKRNI